MYPLCPHVIVLEVFLAVCLYAVILVLVLAFYFLIPKIRCNSYS